MGRHGENLFNNTSIQRNCLGVYIRNCASDLLLIHRYSALQNVKFKSDFESSQLDCSTIQSIYIFKKRIQTVINGEVESTIPKTKGQTISEPLQTVRFSLINMFFRMIKFRLNI